MEKLRHLKDSMTMFNIYLNRIPENEMRVSERSPIQAYIN